MLSPEYENVGTTISRYFRAYGGFRALSRSPYLHVAIIITIASYHMWKDIGWWDLPLAVLPNLVGFTLGGYAILLGLGDEKFRALITGARGKKQSPYITTSATFTHFIVVQALALLFAILAKARILGLMSELIETVTGSAIPVSYVRTLFVRAFWATGYCLFVYALMSVLAATFGVYKLSVWYDRIPSGSKASPLSNRSGTEGDASS